jgi:hypothetical protein
MSIEHTFHCDWRDCEASEVVEDFLPDGWKEFHIQYREGEVTQNRVLCSPLHLCRKHERELLKLLGVIE